MNKFLQQQKCFITTLAPVHMGAGEDYYPTQYVMDDGILYAFDEMQMGRALGGKMMMEMAKQAESGKDAMTALQKKVYEQREKLKAVAERSLPVSSGIQSKYTQTMNGGRNELAIQRTFFNPFDGNPVIPGSGIKGAIRTALLDQLNNGKPLSSKVKDAKNRAGGELQKELLGNKGITDDPMRLLKLSDASYQHIDNLNATEVLYSVRRKRNPVEGRKPNSTTVMLECIEPWRARSFVADISLLDRSLADRNTQVLPADLCSFAACCNRYYLPKLEAELRFLSSKGYSCIGKSEAAWSKRLRELLSGELKKALSENRVFLLRLGKHGGAEDKTLNGVRSVKIMLEKVDGKNRSENRSSTTEVGLACRGDVGEMQNLMPFGWVLVELGEQNLPETMKFVREMAEPAYTRLQKDTARIAEREKVMAEQQAREKAEREKREAEAKADANKVAALAAMSDEMREIHSLLDRMARGEDKGKGAGCQLAGSVGKITDSAVNWPAVEKQKLLEVMPDLLRYLGIDAKADKWKKRINAIKSQVGS